MARSPKTDDGKSLCWRDGRVSRHVSNNVILALFQKRFAGQTPGAHRAVGPKGATASHQGFRRFGTALGTAPEDGIFGTDYFDHQDGNLRSARTISMVKRPSRRRILIALR